MKVAAIVRYTALATYLLTAPSAQAEPMVPTSGSFHITSGSLFFNHASDDPFAVGTLSGDGFVLQLPDEERTTRGIFGILGPLINPSFQTGGVLFGTLEINDAVLQLDPVFFAWQLSMTALPQPVPVVTDPLEGFSLIYPFQLSGFLFGNVSGTEYRYEVFGRGRGSLFMVGPFEDGYVSGKYTNLTFEDTAAVPEPGTLLLIATGVAAIGRRASAPLQTPR